MMKRIFLSLFLVFSIFFMTVVFAADSTKSSPQTFSTSYDVIYDVGADGITIVTEKINLKNLTSEYYANQFKITIGATQISDVRASDQSGIMEVSTQQKDNTTIISVKFNQQIAGLGKTLPWTLQFKSKDFAQNLGKIWELRAPKIAPSNLENYNLTISVPQTFGEPSSINPTPRSQTISSGKMFLTFDKSQLLASGVSANFGTNQLFDFDLAYHLENNNLVPILTNIALPPDTAYQDVIFQRIEPKPINITVDDDGNYLAWYRLNSNQKIDIKVFGSTKLYANSKVKNPVLEDSLRRKYTKADKYWEKDNPQITSKLTEILGEKSPTGSSSSPPTDVGEKVKLIYRFVVEDLKYDPSRLKGTIDRLGAVTALNNPTTAVCMEFTDLFIALIRAAGIPARELDGYAYTANPILRPLSLSKDILHAWPQYWDEKKGWVMVDPTWENTTGGVDYFNKLDLNHFTFAIRGSSSITPIPAGSYKSASEDSNDVKVTLSGNDFLGKPQLGVNIENTNPILSGFPGKIRVNISNFGNAFYPSTIFSINSDKLSILEGNSQKLGPIPAYGTSIFYFNIRTKSLFDNYNDKIRVFVNGQLFDKDVNIKPFLIFESVPVLLATVLLTIILVYSSVLGTHIYKNRFSRKRKKN